MKSSVVKKHLYTKQHSASAVLLSVIGHGQASADSVERQTEPSTVLGSDTPTTEPPVTADTASPATTMK